MERGYIRGERNRMRGKKPKERKNYVLRMPDGSLIEVTREVYLEWYQSRRREKYQIERQKKQGVYSLEALNEYGNIGEERCDTEETVLCKLYKAKVREGIEQLAKEDARLIYLLFFEEMTSKEVAAIFGCSQKTIYNRKKRILSELCYIMRKIGILDGYF